MSHFAVHPFSHFRAMTLTGHKHLELLGGDQLSDSHEMYVLVLHQVGLDGKHGLCQFLYLFAVRVFLDVLGVDLLVDIGLFLLEFEILYFEFQNEFLDLQRDFRSKTALGINRFAMPMFTFLDLYLDPS